MENIKELFAEWGLCSLVEDISDDGDGIGDDLQLTKEGEEARRMIEQELDKAREEGLKDGVKGVWDMIPEKRRIASILSKSITPVERSTEMTKFIGRLEGLSKLKSKE